jgi:DNA mismatch repair protein MutS
LAYLDISTAEFRLVELDSEEILREELLRVSPKEVLLPQDEDHSWSDALRRHLDITLTYLNPDDFDKRRAEERLIKHFEVHSLEGFGIHRMDSGVRAAGAILAYLQANLLGSCSHLKRLLPYSRSDYMVLDEATVRNLEIFQSMSFQGRKGSLLSIVDQTCTPMGGRKLQQWLRYPLIHLGSIFNRQHALAELMARAGLRTEIRAFFDKMNDIERLNGRNSAGLSTPRDLVALKKSLQVLPEIGAALKGCTAKRLMELTESWDSLTDVAEVIETTLTDPPPLTFNAGGVICPGVSAELDHYVSLSRDARSWMANYETQERQRTGITSLKVRYNKVFGYYIEISKANLGAAPSDYFRKQTLVNAERFFTEELKTFETQVLEADEKRLELEQQLFEELRRTISVHSERIQTMAEAVAELDCLAGLAEVAARNDYCQPHLSQGESILIRDGRHPVIEHFLPGGSFVPNDLEMDQENQQVLIITGPNMAGKSTILRQAALIVLLAQIGSFVPASEAHLGLVDRIFTRVGAADDLARGRSTFLVEMQESANILHQATPRSLIILDEIGRGTSTFDGLSIAWAVAEYLHDLQGVGVKTLFATHYHELTDLARTRSRVKNFNVAIKEWQNEIIFFHKLIPGGTNRSYGIQVARLAGLPHEVIERAREILVQLEKGESTFLAQSTVAKRRVRTSREKEPGIQLSLFRPSAEWLRDRIMALDIDRLTPLTALQTLHALKEQIRRGAKESPEPDLKPLDDAAEKSRKP